jgi:DNA polymerase III delta prime subunit
VSASKARSIFHRGKLIVLEIGQVRDMRGVTELAKSARHLIIVTNDVYDRRLSNLRRACKVVKMEKLNTNDIYRYLKAIVQKEKINFVDSSLMQIARNCNGDIRAALIDLEAQSSGERVIERGIFEVLKSLSSSDLKGSREILSNTDMNQIFIWIEENIADSGSIEDIASSYEFLAKADMFRARIIRREAWTLQKYYASMLSASFSKTKSTLYKFPTFYRKSNDDALLEKIGSKLHVSKREAASYIGIIKQLYKKDKSIASSFRFDEEDLEKLK